LRKRIETTAKLQTIVKSMKTLSAVNIRQYEKAVVALDQYLQTITLGLEIVLKDYVLPFSSKQNGSVQRGIVVFGSDQGLCGRFNEKMASLILDTLHNSKQPDQTHLLVIGARIAARLEAAELAIEKRFWAPSSVGGINNTVYQILLTMEQWQHSYQLTHIDLFFNLRSTGIICEPFCQPLLPIDSAQFKEMAQQPWQGRSLPQYSVGAEEMFSALIRQYLLVHLFKAQAESLASEQASRLQSLQNAEKNIQEHLEELDAKFRAERQAMITAELLDLVAGFRTVSLHNSVEPERP
jgi:F-type H+-transporting ATPase subunit gamma